MSKILQNIEIGLDEDLEEKLKWLEPEHASFRILRESIDARKKRAAPKFVYSVEVFGDGETPKPDDFVLDKVAYKGKPVLIIGAGPAGLFSALRLLERGIPVHLFEQGSESKKRLVAINRFWRYGEMDPRNNVGFGEGGAGLYSDGKLITRIKSPHIPYVMKRLVEFGAPEEILYLSNPHVGSDRIRRVIPKLRARLLELGGHIHFDTKISEILVEKDYVTGVKTESGEVFNSDHVILACGHSAEDLFKHLNEIGIFMEGKSFAVGLRIEHPQKRINEIQYGEYASHPKLAESANYKLTSHDKSSDVGVYSFCMCPGGYVLSAGTDNDGLVANGMSNYARNSAYANAAIVVTVDYKKSFGDNLFAGLEFRRKLEREAQKLVLSAGGTKQLPAQRLTDFISSKPGDVPATSCPSGIVPANLHEYMPKNLRTALISAFENFDRNMKGFIHPDALLVGVESRTSCPLRITRDKDSLQSVSHRGLYPTGEGAGYAGGITSAACDGILIAEKIAANPAL